MTFNNTLPQTAIQKEIQALVFQILGNIPAMFAPNELAFYTLEGKNEAQVRDRFAWMLQNALDQSYPGQYIVRKEWSAWGSGREKVDIAVLSVGADISSLVVNENSFVDVVSVGLVEDLSWEGVAL